MFKIIWNDLVPIEGNDYTVQKIIYATDGMALIQYGKWNDDGIYSEAEVSISELAIVKDN